MAEKGSTLVLKVDLDCHLCYRKIRKTLYKLQDRENIRSISYDEKNNAVILTGPFDPQKLSGKLCCKAGKVIKDIQIKDSKEKEKEKEKPQDQPKLDGSKDKPKESQPAESKDRPKESKSGENGSKKDKPKEPKPAETSQGEAKDPKPADTGKEKPKPQKSEPPSSEPAEKPRTGPVFLVGPETDYPAPLVWPAGPVCYCRPAFDGYHAGCPCGRAWGQPVYGGPSQFFCEEDQSSCSVM